jgi:alkylated DNA repair dioxygenase AlkB
MNFDQIISTEKSSLKITKDFFSAEEADLLFQKCLDLDLVKNPKIKVYGKEATMHRSIGFFSDVSHGYTYSGQIAKSQTLPPFLAELLAEVNQKLGCDFNGILVNRYEDGSETIGAHSDDEKGLGKGGSVVGISLGAVRNMRFRGKLVPLSSNGKKFLDMTMPHGCLFLMEGNFQKEFTHEIPSQKSITDIRISLTFRKHIM